MLSTPKIFEDKDILVIDKSANLVVDPSSTQKEGTLVDWLKSNYASTVYHSKDARMRWGVVHRLDKDTSGILVVGKNQQSFDNLQAQFKQRKTKKEYLALVHGWVEKSGRIEGDIGRNPGNRKKFTVLDEGKEAVTEYGPVKRLAFSSQLLGEVFPDFNKIQLRKLDARRYSNYTLLSCKPLTGRTHQIRVHLKYIGHPIVSDEKYAGRKVYRLDKRWCPRQFLHAKKLGFYHPGSGEWVEFESELPWDLKKALSKLADIGRNG